MIVAELFAQGPRAAAVNIGVALNWLANFFVGLTFPSLQVRRYFIIYKNFHIYANLSSLIFSPKNALEELVFLPYTVLLAIFIVYLYKFLPETKGKTFEEISASFGNGEAAAKDSGDFAMNDKHSDDRKTQM